VREGGWGSTRKAHTKGQLHRDGFDWPSPMQRAFTFQEARSPCPQENPKALPLQLYFFVSERA
jgi:hypothetical protein